MNNTQSPEQIASRKAAILTGDAARVEAQKKAGKLLARERVEKLLDEGSFVELGMLSSRKDKAVGVITGYGTVQDRPVYVFAQDYTVQGGGMGEAQARKILRLLDMAEKNGAPVVAMLDSAGLFLDEGVAALNAYSRINAGLAKLSGVCPTVAMVLGSCIGMNSVTAQMCDVTVMAQSVSVMTAVGPQVASSALGKEFTAKTLGGADVMAKQGGCAISAETEDEAIAAVAKLLALLPSCNEEDAPLEEGDDLNRTLTADGADLAAFAAELADNGDVTELYAAYGKAVKTSLIRMGGRTVALVAADGKLDADALKKTARFVGFADAYQIPVVTLLNSDGVAVPQAEGQAELLKALAASAAAYAGATTAKLQLVCGNCIGQAYAAFGGFECADMCWALPGAVISTVTPEAAAQLFLRKEILESAKDAEEARADAAAKYVAEQADGVVAAAKGMVDDVIEAAEARKMMLAAIEMLACKREATPARKHANLPL